MSSLSTFKCMLQREYGSKNKYLGEKDVFINLQCIHCKTVSKWSIFLGYYYCDKCCKCSKYAIDVELSPCLYDCGEELKLVQ